MKRHLFAICTFAILSVVMTYPLVTYLSTGVPGWEGDNLYYIWQLWWVKHALLNLGVSPFFDPLAYYPIGYNVASGELTPANSILSLPFTIIGGAVLSYNVILLFSFFASALGACLWIWRLTSRFDAGLIGGVIFGFLPYRFAHLPGHLELMATQWIPFTLLAIECFIESKQIRHAIAVGVFVALTALASWYYAYMVMLLAPIYVALRALPWREFWLERRWWQGLGVMFLVAILLILPFAVPYLEQTQNGQASRSLADLEYWSLNVYDFFIPNVAHPIWGKDWGGVFSQETQQWVERGVTLGILPIASSILGLRGFTRVAWIKAILVVWIASYLIALGPTLHFGDRQVSLPLLPFVPLPTYALYQWVPFTSGMRVMARFGLWTGLMTAALAGWGASQLSVFVGDRFPRFPMVRNALVALFFCVLLFEFSGMINLNLQLRARPVDIWLRQLNTPVVVIELPVQQAERPLQNYYTTIQQQATSFGPAGDSFPPPMRAQRSSILRDFPSPSSLSALREWQVNYVLFTPSQIKNWNELHQAIETTSAFHFDRMLGDVWVYQLERE